MTLKNSIGMVLIVAGLAVGLPGFQLHRVQWALAGCLLFLIGLLLLRRPQSGRGRPGAVGDDPGDLGDWDGGNHSSGGHSSGHLDLPSIDFDN